VDRQLMCEFLVQEEELTIVNLLMKNEREVADHMLGVGLARRPKRGLPQSQTYPILSIMANIGDNVNVIVSFVESSAKFYVQLACNEDLISKVCREVNFEYSKFGDKYSKANPIKGRACAAKYAADHHWYRATIIGRPSPTKVEVSFVDYGNTARLLAADVKELKPEFTLHSAQAVECKLTGVGKLGIFTKQFQDIAESQRMIIRIDNADQNVLSVTLYQVNGRQRLNINDFLLGRGPAPAAPVPLPPGRSVAPYPYADREGEFDSDDDEMPGPSRGFGDRYNQGRGNRRY